MPKINKPSNEEKALGFYNDLSKCKGSQHIKYLKNKNHIRKSSELFKWTDQVVQKLLKESVQPSLSDAEKLKIDNQIKLISDGLTKLDTHADELTEAEPHRIWRVVFSNIFPNLINSKGVKRNIQNLKIELLPEDVKIFLKKPEFRKTALKILNQLDQLKGNDSEKMQKIYDLLQPASAKFLKKNYGAEDLLPFIEAIFRTDLQLGGKIYDTHLKDWQLPIYGDETLAKTTSLQAISYYLFETPQRPDK